MCVEKLLVCCVLLLSLQAHFSWSQTLMVPPQPLIVPVGSDVTLPCQLDPVKNIKDLAVEWVRQDLKPRYIHIRRDGLDLLLNQNSLYLGRTRLSESGLQFGDMSLQLSSTRLSDGGTYRCFIPQMDTGADVTLHVVSVSPVSLTLTKDHLGSLVLNCKSRNWFPEPEVVWLDSEGTVLTGARTEAQRGVNEETFSVSSRLSVEQSLGNTFTCRVRHQETRQSREAQVNITDEFLEVPSCSVAWALFSLGFLLLLVSAVVFVMWKFKVLNGKKSENKNIELGEEEEKEKMIKPEDNTSAAKPRLNTQSLELKSSEHKENLEKIEDELKFVVDVINKLTETKEFLMKLKEKPQEIINQTNTQIDVKKNKSYSIINPIKDRKENERDVQIKELERQKEECERAIKQLDTHIKATENLILEAAQRKGQLEEQFKSEAKLAGNEKRRREASERPGSQQIMNEGNVNVPVATITAPNRTQGYQDESTEKQDAMDEQVNKLVNEVAGMSLDDNRDVSTGQM